MNTLASASAIGQERTVKPIVVPQVEVTKSTCNSTTNKVETGTINTPEYPKDYGSNSRCEWLITSSHRIRLVFNYFFVENGWDYFHVYEGKSTSSKRIGKLTGGHTNKVIKSSENYLYLKFTSDSVINKKGFLIAYEVPYGGMDSEEQHYLKLEPEYLMPSLYYVSVQLMPSRNDRGTLYADIPRVITIVIVMAALVDMRFIPCAFQTMNPYLT
ncbi:hypothetical protein pdam_00006911 [Pocillopora damicornis]|uniref:CUB domain-containing protein n=1 Tax=Pocillopora damicornis TaxID=46731 RepID=A0A3M6U9F0_POCDA|nr:hypothetical protein pdam_00006911 [Pocillopora damicornis]